MEDGLEAYTNGHKIEDSIFLYEGVNKSKLNKGRVTAGFMEYSTRNTVFSQSGERGLPEIWEPITKSRLEQTTKEALEINSYNEKGIPSFMEKRTPKVCGEPKALNEIEKTGANMDDLLGISISGKDKALKPLCNNCVVTARGIPFVQTIFPSAKNIEDLRTIQKYFTPKKP